MLVFGDPDRREAPADKLRIIQAFLADAAAAGAGIVGHAALVAALIEAGELAQGLADAAFDARRGVDAGSDTADRAMDLTLALARLVAASWSGDEPGAGAPPAAELAALAALSLPAEIAVRHPEGFSHYAVYPEAHLVAALTTGLGADTRVIGLRSIGTTLSAMVAAALGARRPVTLRPVGHPFRRTLSLDPSLAADLLADPAQPRAIVDEGPGLSGSSVACVVAHLAAGGVEAATVRLFPSHLNGPGAEASPASRAVWSRCRSEATSFDALALGGDARHGGLAGWVRDLVGDPVAAPRDISGGRWRALRYPHEDDWPPVLAWQERRKFLLDTAGGRFLLKFTGLGRFGMAKLDRARRLAEAGFSPEVMGWRHGFLVERWLGDAAPLDPAGEDRPALVARLAGYIAFRARSFPGAVAAGASLDRLAEMALHNTAESLGPEAAERLRERLVGLDRWTPLLHPIETDNRLHRWEWLRLGDRILKTDAIDHHVGHDLVGDQDPVWDVAGAIVEFDLSPEEADRLSNLVRQQTKLLLPASLITIMTVFYRTFQLGHCGFSASACDTIADQQRFAKRTQLYRAPLQRLLA